MSLLTQVLRAPSGADRLAPKLLWLEVMRAAAAVWVLLHHAVFAVDKFYGGELVPQWRVFMNGSLGVDFFFVLSGFIIALSSSRLAHRGLGLREYARARLLRVYVPYLPVGVLLLVLFMLVPAMAQGREVPGIWTSLTLLPSYQPPALSVAWTLMHELLFYAVFSLYFISRPLLAATLAVWVGAIVAVWLSGVELGPVATPFLAPINLCFVLGVLAYRACRHGVSARLGLAGLLGGLALIGIEAASPEPDRVRVAIGCVGLVVAAASNLLNRYVPGTVLLTLGAASYAVYLVHNPALSAWVRVAERYGPSLPAPAVLVLISVGALGAGWLYYVLWERPMLARARNLRRRVRVGPPVAQGGW